MEKMMVVMVEQEDQRRPQIQIQPKAVENNFKMRNNWKETTLGEVAEIVMGQSPQGQTCNRRGEGLPLLNGPTEFGECYPVAVQFTTDVKRKSRPMDILFCVRGSTTGRMNWSDDEYAIGRGLAAIRHKNGSDYRYFVKGMIDFHLPHLLGIATGSTFPSVTGEQLAGLQCLLPPLHEQKAIAAVLSSLDDKIELLRRQNKTLEAIAQTIFKEWFVKFKIKGQKLKIKNETGLPEGWTQKGIDEIADFLNGLALQNYPPKNKEDVLPVIKIRELKAGITEQTDKASKEIDAKYIIENGDVLFSWSGSLDVVLWCYGKGVLNQHLFKVTSKKYPKWFYYYWILEHLQFFRSIAEAKATTMGHIQRHHLSEAIVTVPNDDFMAFADDIMKPVFEHVILNNSQIQTLSKLRDLLLPKLMKGEIRVKS
jgi:type I restriction enzyme S subunit